MAGNLHFDVDASNSASGEFTEIAAELTELARQLKALDGKTARMRAEVAVAGAAALTKLDAQLKALPNNTTTTVNVDVDKDAPKRLGDLAANALKLGSTGAVAAVGVMKLRTAVKNIIDPDSPSLLRRASQAIGVMHTASNIAAPVIDRLRGGLLGLNIALLALGASGSAVQLIAAATTSLVQLSGAALVLPAALLAGAVAVNTLKLGFKGFGDVMKAIGSGDAAKFNEAIAKLAPAAQNTAKAIRSLKPAFDELQLGVQQKLFAGMAPVVQATGRAYLDVLKPGLAGVAAQFNGMGKEALLALRNVSNIGNVRTIVGNTDTALGRMRATLGNVLTGFLTLGSAGSAWLPRLAAAIDTAAARFSAWSARITGDGTFNRWVGNAVAAFTQFVQLLKNIGAIASTVFSALNNNGVGLFATLVGLTAQLKAFLQTAQGQTALQALAQTLQVTGDAVQRVFGAALQQLGPILTALAPLVQAFATALSGQLVTVLNVLGPILQRVAAELAQHPELMIAVARAAALIVIGFAPMAAVISVVATALKALLIAQVVGVALRLLGVESTVAGRILQALVSPMRLLGELGPLVARGVGLLAAQLGIMAGPIGVLVVAFATLYLSSSQFRDAVNQLAGVIGGLFVRALQQAGQILTSTVRLITDFGTAIGSALSGIGEFGSKLASVFGPAGKVVGDVLTDIFNHLGMLPGAALAAAAAFVVFGKIAPLVTAASVALTAFSARLLAVQTSSAIAGAAATGLGTASGFLGTALGRLASALPLIGVGLIALGTAYEGARNKSDDLATSLIQGTQSIAQISAAIEKHNADLVGWTTVLPFLKEDLGQVRAEVEAQIAAMGPLDAATARVKVAQAEWQEALRQFGPDSEQARTAAQNLAVAQGNLSAEQKRLADATKTATDRMKEQADQMSAQVNSALAYAQAVRRTAEAQTAANEALKKSGADSDAYKGKVLDLALAMQSQGEAARRQAEALGGTEAGVRAYSTEMLKAADLSTQAGRDAFKQLASGLDNAGLAALSAAAKMSGLRTEVMTLPDGRTVTVVVAADQGKLPEVKQALQDVATKKYVGTVTVLSNTDLARNGILQTVAFADGTKATIKISGDGSPALLTVGQTKYTIDSTTGTLKVLGDVAPADANLTGMKLKVDATTGVMSLDANPGPADGKLSLQLGKTNSSIGTISIDGNPTLANGKTTQAVTFADGSKGTITIDGQPDPATGKINATVKYADGSTGTIQVQANDAPARSTVAGTVTWIKNQNPTLTVNVVYSGSSPAAVRQAGSGGLVKGFSGGGVVGGGPMRFAAGGIVPGYAPGVDNRLALISPGEAVLVPELTRALGARRIMAANAEASGGRPGMAVGNLAGLMEGSVGKGRIGALMSSRSGSGAGSGAAAAAALMTGELQQLRGELRTQTAALSKVIGSARPITVQDRSGNPVETARAASLALRLS